MALRLEISSVTGLKQKGDNYLKITFRETTFKTSIFTASENVVLNQTNRWSASPSLKPDDVLGFKLYQHSKFRGNKLIGSHDFKLQRLVESGSESVQGSLSPSTSTVSYTVSYVSEPSPTSPSSKSRSEASYSSNTPEDELQLIIPEPEEEEVVVSSANKRRSSLRNSSSSLTSAKTNRKKSLRMAQETTGGGDMEMTTPIETMVEVELEEPPTSLRENPSMGSGDANTASVQNVSTEDLDGELGEMPAAQDVLEPILSPVLVKQLEEVIDTHPKSTKAQPFNVCVKIIEAKQLSGLNIDPVISVQVDEKKKNTAVQKSTNSPSYNEYFVFEMNQPPAKLFYKLITISCFHSKGVLQSDELIGSFKLDIGTVYAQPSHQFLQKWAMLTDPTSGECKGYVKCDISVLTKEDGKATDTSEESQQQGSDDIESNLLSPEGVKERPLVKLVVKVFRADSLPKLDGGVGAALKKAFSSGNKDLINPYVKVSFAGSTGQTSICKKTCYPVWNEKITFLELFPPLFQNIQIQLMHDATGTDDVLATHFIPISEISNNGDDGFLPTFGPSFIHLYGAPRDSTDDDFEDLNKGLQDGVAYRGRLLISITTEMTSGEERGKEIVKVEKVSPLDEKCLGPQEEYLLFGTIFEANMISQKYSDKQISYEISVGDPDDMDGDGQITEEDKKLMKEYKGVTGAIKPVKAYSNQSKDDFYYLPIGEEKPCTHSKSMWFNFKRRLYNSNIVDSTMRTLELGLADVEKMEAGNHEDTNGRLLGVLTQLISDCEKLSEILENDSNVKTKLDKERYKICKEYLITVGSGAEAMKELVGRSPVAQIVSVVSDYLDYLEVIKNDVQSSIPDIFITMLASGKRVAFTRIPARDLIYSSESSERGKYCGRTRTFFLQSPLKPLFKVRSRIEANIWFGLMKDKPHCMDGLPRGYRSESAIAKLDDLAIMPPTKLIYQEKHQLQFRAHLFQARSLIAADASGLSDPYARVYFSNACMLTQVIEETLSPTWDTTLIAPPLILYGSQDDLAKVDFRVTVDFYDKDAIGEDEFIGRAYGKCYVRFGGQPYIQPLLKWLDVFRCGEPGGQVLAAFELLQLNDQDNAKEYPKLVPEQKKVSGFKATLYPVPPVIKPTLSKYRLGVYFWGLRDLQKVQLMSVDRPRVDIECGGQILSSNVISNYEKTPNFAKPLKFLDIELPDQEFYCPPINITVVDCRAFGRCVLVGTHVIGAIARFVSRVNESPLHAAAKLDKNISIKVSELIVMNADTGDVQGGKATVINIEEEEDDTDWWSKYYASLEHKRHGRQSIEGSQKSLVDWPTAKLPKCQMFDIYSCELEKVKEFRDGGKRFSSFDLLRGKQKTGKEDKGKVGTFKGEIQLSKYPLPKFSVFDIMPNNQPTKVTVRVYIVRALDVKPNDIGGLADLYPVLKFGKTKIIDRDNFIPNQLNPIFGRVYELSGSFPMETILTVGLKDMDIIGSDDLIGVTTIDLEDRFYSFNRSFSGLQRIYETSGMNTWRQPLKPTAILTNICKELKLPSPVVTRNSVSIGNVTFTLDQVKANTVEEPVIDYSDKIKEENMALAALHHWKDAFGYKFVSEHVETRSLYNPDSPGICQGKLELWVDVFPADRPAPPPIDITPRKPRSYQLRVVIWNTYDVILDDENVISGEKMSDIYVKGWLTEAKEAQMTDIHYRSVTGEGNFNWRFVFDFDYLSSEEKIVVKKKGSIFAVSETETKMPPNFNMQLWDADSFSGDDFLGSITFDLNNIPRGAKTSKTCSLELLEKDESSKPLSLFKQKRIRGFWPTVGKDEKTGETILAGKIEAEFHLLSKEEAEASPVGLGRKEPEPLPEPNRPETSFVWFMNPLKAFKYIIWGKNKGKFIKLFFFIFLVYFLVLFVYSLPGYTVKKIIGA